MVQLSYGASAYSRSRGNLPPLELVNMFVERSNSNQKGVILQSRRGLIEADEVGTGPVRATLKKDGVFNGDRFTLSGNEFYRGATLLGSVTGTGTASIAASDIEVLVCDGTNLYSYDGTDFELVIMPDPIFAPATIEVTKIIFTAGYFIAIRKGTDEWYFSDIEDGRTFDALNFATEEHEPDELRDVVVLDGVLIFGGAESIGFWGATGDADLPYSPIQQRVFEQGVIATGCMVVVDNTFFWIGADKITYRNGEAPQAVSDDGVVEKAVVSSTFSLFLLEDERHKFLCQRHDLSTMTLDVTTSEWFECKSYGRANFRATAGFGDDETGKIWEWGGYEDPEGILERLFMAGAELAGAVQIDNLRLICEVGTTPSLSGPEPVVEMASSRDAGNTWSQWRSKTLGQQGQYRNRCDYRALGMFDDPGMLFKFRVTYPVSFRLSAVGVNEPTGGRSR